MKHLEKEAAGWQRLTEAVGLILGLAEGGAQMNFWQRLLRRKQLDEQLDNEVQFHLDQHASDLISQGYAPEEAHRQARLALGGAQQVKEECRDARGTRWLDDLRQDLRYALRALAGVRRLPL